MRTKAMNPPNSGQYMPHNIYEPSPDRAQGAGGRYAWSATCSLGVGKAHATWRRRSWRKTKLS